MQLGSSPGASPRKPIPRRGLGDLLKGISKALGVKTCGGCDKRAKGLNKLTGKLRF